MNKIPVNLKAASDFLALIAEGEPVTFQTFDDRGKDRALAKIIHGELDDCAQQLQALNARQAGVFFTVNFTDGKGRQAENVTGVRALFVDLDGAPLGPVMACGIEPHAVIESSTGRWHAYWLAADVLPGQFKALQQAIARRFGGDLKVCDLSRVMRVPGFVHHKAAPFLSRIVTLHAVQPYRLADLVAGLQLQNVEVRTPHVATGALNASMIEGARNVALTSEAGGMRRRGLSPAAIEAALQVINRERCSPPLNAGEVSTIAKSVGRYAPAHSPPAATNAEPRDVPGPTWPEPILPSTARVPEIEADVLPGWLGEMANAVAKTSQTPAAMSVMVVVAILGAVLQRRFEIAPWGSSYTEPLSIWTMPVMPSATRKSAVFGEFLAVIVDWEKRRGDRMRREINRVLAARDVSTKRIEQLRQSAGRENDPKARAKIQEDIAVERDAMPAEIFATRIFTGDVTSERLQAMLVEQGERIAIFSDEAGVFQNMAGRYSGGMASTEIYLQGHAGSSARVDRAGRTAHLDKPAVSMCLAIQPGVLTDTGKNKQFHDSGLMGRIQYVVPLSTVGRRDVRFHEAIDPDIKARWEQNICALLDGLCLPIGAPRVLTFAPGAREHWLQLAEDIEREQGDGGKYAHMSSWTGKLAGAAARIACLIELGITGIGATTVSVSSTKRAVRLARLLVPHAEAAFRLMGAADAESDALALFDWIRKHQLQEFTRREAMKSLQARFPSVDRIAPAIRQLQDWSILSGDMNDRGTRGAPSKFYRVNPRIYVITSDKP